MAVEKKELERAILIIALCVIVALTLIDLGSFTALKLQANRINELINLNRQQQIGIESFIMQLQQCETLDDLDDALKVVNVERIK